MPQMEKKNSISRDFYFVLNILFIVYIFQL